MEKIIFRSFLTAMVLCATMVVIIIWFEDSLPEFIFKIAGTFFIFGLANFLAWVSIMTYRFLDKVKG